MTELIAAVVVAAFLGAGAGSFTTRRWCVARGDVARYDAHRDWRALHEQADHDHRRARRWQSIAEARAQAIVDLSNALRAVALRPPPSHRPAHMRRSPVPTYGAAR